MDRLSFGKRNANFSNQITITPELFDRCSGGIIKTREGINELSLMKENELSAQFLFPFDWLGLKCADIQIEGSPIRIVGFCCFEGLFRTHHTPLRGLAFHSRNIAHEL
jgi:hypothetical protein